MANLIGAIALIAVLIWLFSRRRSRPAPAPEDDVTTGIDHEALAEAEQELADDSAARPLDADMEEAEEDDWGPGAGPGGRRAG